MRVQTRQGRREEVEEGIDFDELCDERLLGPALSPAPRGLDLLLSNRHVLVSLPVNLAPDATAAILLRAKRRCFQYPVNHV